LRTWDAIAEARIQQGVAEPRLDRNGLILQFGNDSAGIPTEFDGSTAGGRKQPSRRKQGQGLADMVHDALTPAMVPNWRMRSEKYIEQSDEAFRQLVALAFSVTVD
jgi:hypothetical protein